jgi:hypothetical protein
MKAVLSVPHGAVVNINSEPFYQNGKYINNLEKGNVEIMETAIPQ